ncbi:MAG: Lacal_2735 family protein [Bacteroidia bacterium]|nr:Lacal_2735 family protein [Bacteroidia bacterium]
MFGLFKKDPVKKLEKKYQDLLVKGMNLQRGGDIKGYAKIMAEADQVLKKIDDLRTS